MKLHLKLPSWKKIPFQLTAVLRTLLLLAVLTEIFLLYQYGFLSIAAQEEVQNKDIPQVLNIAAYQKVRSFIEQNSVYEIPPYTLQNEGIGKENPLSE